MSGSKRNKQIKKQKQAQRRTQQAAKQAASAPVPAAQKALPVQLPLFKRPSKFRAFVDLATYAKQCVYVIARVRQFNGQTTCTTLGTGFLAAPSRFVTCAHVMDNSANGGDKHQDGDIYCLAQKDDEGRWHKAFIKPEQDKTLFTYDPKATDLAVIYLPDDFYKNAQGDFIKHPDQYLTLGRAPLLIGADVGVLGYPMQEIGFTADGTDLDLGGVLLRADRGVVNAHFQRADNNVHYYEFTMAFNPGNSGGPIMDLVTGKVIALVHGYQSVPINFAEDEIPPPMRQKNGPTKVLTPVRALYSIGIDSRNHLSLEKQHGLLFG